MWVAFTKSVVWFALKVALFKSCLYFRVLSGKHWMLSTSVIFTTVCTETWSQRTSWSPRMEWSNYVTLDLQEWSVQVGKIVTIQVQVQSPNSLPKDLVLEWLYSDVPPRSKSKFRSRSKSSNSSLFRRELHRLCGHEMVQESWALGWRHSVWSSRGCLGHW